ncbi:MAG: ribosome recycling factor [Parachlamydiales bacterium]|nr:ribosome recycling factor [Parachlamydiales bacterium]
MSVLDDAKQKMQTTIEHLKTDLKGIRSGRANPAMLDGIEAEIYGAKVKLKNIANISAPEPRALVVTPFDPSNIPAVSKAIEKSNLGLQPVNDKTLIRITIPPMDSKLRQEMVKQTKKKGEESKVNIRNTRRDCNELIKKQKAAGDIPEDLMKKQEKQIQELTDKFCKEIEDVVVQKEKDILEV